MGRVLLFALSVVVLAMRPGHAGTVGGYNVSIERMASKLDVPWSIAFLPECEFLISERGGSLLHFDAFGNRTEISGVPRVYSRGQGGLLDVVASLDFSETRQLFISYSKLQNLGAGTAVAAARLSPDSTRLLDLVEIFEMVSRGSGGRHFGSRIVENLDGTLFVTLGERGDRMAAQDLSNHNGTVVRIGRDGSVPSDNPFAGKPDARAEIWSYGHRNPQGAALDQDGRLWTSEHGARGGDEINLVRKGLNYGWPVISYGVHYSGQKIGEGTSREGLEQPEFYWDPSIAPSGLTIYSGRLWPDWKGQFFVGSLKSDFISRIDPMREFGEVERIKLPETKRVRDVREAPDGSIWFLSEDRGGAYRIVPEDFESECPHRSL